MSVLVRKIDRKIRLDILSYANMTKFEQKIFELLEQKSAYYKQNEMEDVHPYNFLSLEMLAQYESDVDNIHNTLLKLSDAKGNGENRMVYLYPFMFIEDDKVVVKISILRPDANKGEDHIRDAERMTMKAFEFSLPVLDRIAEYRKVKPLRVPSQKPESLIIKKKTNKIDRKEQESIDFYPDALAFEVELQRLLDTGFNLKVPIQKTKDIHTLVYSHEPNYRVMNIKPVPIPHAIDDWMHYLKTSGYLIQLTDDYHMIKMSGKALSTEVYSYIIVYTEALKNVVLPKVHSTIKQFMIPAYEQAYKRWQLFHNKDLEEQPEDEFIEGSELLISVFNKASLKPMHEKTIGFSLKKIQRCIQILKKLIEFRSAEVNSDKNRLILSLRDQISSNSQQKKLLTTIDFNYELTKIGISPLDEGIDYLKDIFTEVSESFAFYTKNDSLNEIRHYQKIHLVDPRCLLAVVANLAKLAIENQNYTPDYEIARNIQKKIETDIRIHPELNEHLSEKEIEAAKKVIAELEPQILKIRSKSLKEGEKENKTWQYDWSRGILLSAVSIWPLQLRFL